MQYVIKPKVKKSKVLSFDENIDGLEVNTKTINIEKMILTDPELINQYISIRLEKRFKEILTKLCKLIEDPDTDEDGVARLLGEVEKLRQIIDVKYSKYLEGNKKRELITKIVLIEEELKKKYLEIKYIESMFNSYDYEETYSRGRSM